MRIVVSGGGTAGHINPALAVAGELVSRGHEVEFFGTPTGLESRLVPAAGLPFVGLPAAGFNRSKPLTLFTSSLKVASSVLRAKKMFRDKRPDVVVGFGGYVSIPVGFAATACHIPLVIHEQNSVPGLTNKALASRATEIALTYPDSRKYLSTSAPMTVTGNPVRASILSANRKTGRDFLGIPDDALVLLVFGGSLGARHINEALVAMRDRLLAIKGLTIIHVTGRKDFDSVRETLGLPETEKRWQLYAYMDRMGDALAASDLVVARAGATSIAEITALGIPSILIPYPYATDDHQTKNAAACACCGAAEVISDSELDTEAFSAVLMELLKDGERRAKMAAASRELGGLDATSAIVEMVLRAVEEG